MELFFTVTPAVDPDRRQAVVGGLQAVLPGGQVDVSPDGTALRVVLPPTTDRFAAIDALTFRLQDLGFTALEMRRSAPPPPMYAPPMYAPPRKQPRTVRLSVFLISLISSLLVCAILMFSVGMVFMSIYQDSQTLGTEGTEGYSGKIGLIDQIFSDYALYDTNGDLLLDSMLKAYVAATGDKYAAYYTQAEFDALMAENGGELVGIGITVTESVAPVGIMIISVMKNSPAAAAGVRAGDVITVVGEGENAISVAEAGFDVASAALRGEEGTVAHFKVLRDGAEIPFTITRARVEYESVTGRVSETDQTVGIVSITQFMTNTPAQFKAEMERLITAGCTSFVFDVRNNPGGDLKSIIAVLSFFLNKDDLIVTVVNKDGSEEKHVCAPVSYDDDYAACSVREADIGKYRQYGLAVLANGYTASAAELFCAVLRDYSLAPIVGTTTYGKGVLQHVFSLESFGYSGGVKLTTGYYNPPSGVNYDGVGVAPDGAETPLDDAVKNKNIYLLTEAEDNQLQAAIAAAKQ
ncbi:MAG: PDZ domain-containing protein [Clostridia bacterium]|nr:PDZ domain-containing protein [Clostridia bacterium]